MRRGFDVPKSRPGAARLFEVVPMAIDHEGELRRRRLKFRVWHRGMREVDLILGRYADAHLAGMSASDLDAFEALLDTPDRDVLSWVLGEAPVPPEQDTPLVRNLIVFHRGQS